ncbi:ABC transporter permease [Mobilitalea sibirica]|uniref:ABC transporter permease n=1 Tax=Mobilitalea sibirica TaxID=1462919 RepID=A0A8J7KZQ6_9FIRM|nr:ABC transporter permease subunit [Mobilitalea sibirica]MBH1940728.1 ABC transporter permease [Mobilitalea sibirica]
MNGTKNIIIKELTRVFTDKKLIFSLFIMPGVMIMVMYSIMGNLMKNMMTDIEENIPTVYIQNAPEDLQQTMEAVEYIADISYLSSTDQTDSIKNDILYGNVDLLVVFDEGFRDTINAYKEQGDAIPEVKTFYNTAEDYSNAARSNFVNNVLSTYQQTLLAKRLGNMELLQVFYIDKDPESSVIVDQKKEDGRFISMLLPLLMNIMLFSGAMALGVDAITGEKERGTLSSMLLSPIKRSEIVFGKLVSLAILSSISAVIYAVSAIIGIQRLNAGQAGGDMGSISLAPLEMVQLFVILLVVVYLYVGLVSLVAVYARTAKEANTYVAPLMIFVMLGSIMTMFSGGSDRGLTYFAIPIYNSAISIQNLIMGELTMAQFGITVGTIMILAAFVTALITKAFNSEKVMFNA